MTGSVPEDVRGFKVEDLNELSQCREALEGVWESSEAGKAIFNEQINKANANIAKAHSVEAKAAEVAELRKKVTELAASNEQKFQEWQTVESEMLTAIEQFTQPRLVRKLQEEHDEAQLVSDSLKTAVMDKDTSLGLFIKQYKENQTKIRRYEHLRAGLE